jgi:hypothetical protein
MTYQPDPALVRECARLIINSQIEEIRDLGQMDLGEMCEDEIVAIQEPLGGWDAPGASDAADALINAVREDIKAAVITHTWAAATAEADDPSKHHPLAQIARECGIIVADVRKTLIADSYGYHDRANRLIADARAHGGLDQDALDAHSAATSYAYLLAALLRIVEDRHGEDEALGMACMVDAVRESGTDVLEDANHDIDERANGVAQ